MKRISRSQEHEAMVKALTSGETPVFREIWRLLIFAAVLGHSRKHRVPLGTVEAGKAMPQEIIQGNSSVWPGLLYMLALSETNDGKVLTGEEQSEEARVTIFEEYANGGLCIIAAEAETHAYSLDSILALLVPPKSGDVGDPIDGMKI